MTSTTATSARRRRRAAAAASVVAGALVLAACGQAEGGSAGAAGDEESAGGATTAAGGDEQVTLQFAWWGSDKRHAYTQELIDMYMEENPNVEIVGTYATFGDYWDRLNTNIAGGDAPDVMQHETRYIREYVSRDLLADLYEFEDIIDLENLDPAVAETGVLDGSMYAVPIGVNAFTVAADPAVFDAAGVEMPDDETWDWQDWVDIAAQISEGTGGEKYGVQPRPEHDAMLDIFARQRGEALFTAEGEVGLSEETVKEYWEVMMAFHETGGAPAATEALEIDAAELEGSVLATGEGATAPFWSNQLPALEEAAGKELTLLRFPGETTNEQSGMFLKPAQFWSIGANTEHPEEAAKFVDFLLNDPDAIAISLSERGLPANLERREEVLDDLPPADQRTAAFLDEIGPDLVAPPQLPPPGGGELESILKRLYEELLFGTITVDEAAASFIDQVESAIS